MKRLKHYFARSGETQIMGNETPKLSHATIEYAEILTREARFAQDHRSDTDEELLRYLRSYVQELGFVPKKSMIPGFSYIKCRLGPWPRVLEKAGLKERKRK